MAKKTPKKAPKKQNKNLSTKQPVKKTAQTVNSPEKQQAPISDSPKSILKTLNKKGDAVAPSMAMGKQNYILIAIGFGIIILGFALMIGGGSKDPNVFDAESLFSFRRITLAPLVVLFGFLFEVYAIMKKPKTSDQ